MQFVSAAHLDLKLYNYALSKILCNFVVNILNKKKKIPVNCVYIQKVFNRKLILIPSFFWGVIPLLSACLSPLLIKLL